MSYIDTQTNEYPLTEYQIKQANPQVSFPNPFKSERYKPVVGMPQPTFDAITQRVDEVAPVDKGTHWEQTWSVVALDAATVSANQVRATAQAREAAKSARTASVAAITVTTAAGHTFDGDETSQTRMVRAIVALNATATPSITWVLANNTVIQATAAELTEALALAGAAQAAVWVV